MATQDLLVSVNTTPSFSIQFKLPDKTYQNLNGYTFWFTVKKDKSKSSVDDSEAVIKKNWSITTSLTATAVQLTLTDTTPTSTMPVGAYVYDLKVKDTTGAINLILSGNYIFCQSVTQRAI